MIEEIWTLDIQTMCTTLQNILVPLMHVGDVMFLFLLIF